MVFPGGNLHRRHHHVAAQDWERVEAERRRVKAAEMEERAKLKELGRPVGKPWAMTGMG